MIIDRAPNGDRATFSSDRRFRYHLFRRLHERCCWHLDIATATWSLDGGTVNDEPCMLDAGHGDAHSTGGFPVGKLAAFIMVNPSTADAYKPDPTITDVMKRCRLWGYDSLSVVNLFALRTPDPADLKAAPCQQRGNDAVNDEQIVNAAGMAHLVVCAWGNHGVLDGRGAIVLDRLRRADIAVHHLGLTKGGFPKHPLARGVHRIPASQDPMVWAR